MKRITTLPLVILSVIMLAGCSPDPPDPDPEPLPDRAKVICELAEKVDDASTALDLAEVYENATQAILDDELAGHEQIAVYIRDRQAAVVDASGLDWSLVTATIGDYFDAMIQEGRTDAEYASFCSEVAQGLTRAAEED